MAKILNFGSLNIDKVYKVEEFVKPGETIKSSGVFVYAGGKGLNQSLSLAKAGGNVYHAGAIGVDGTFLKEALDGAGVNTSLVETVDCVTGHAIIQVNKKGENCIILDSGANGKIEKEYVDYVLKKFNEGDLLVLQNEISEIDYIVDKASEKGMRVVLNPSPIDENIYKIDLNKISYILLNEIEGELLSKKKNYEEILDYFIEKYPNLNVVLTLGSKGSIYSSSEKRIHQKIYEVDSVDTTAAGDTFTGYFISGIAKEKNIEEIMDMSSRASAICVTREGASSSIPTVDEVEKYVFS